MSAITTAVIEKSLLGVQAALREAALLPYRVDSEAGHLVFAAAAVAQKSMHGAREALKGGDMAKAFSLVDDASKRTNEVLVYGRCSMLHDRVKDLTSLEVSLKTPYGAALFRALDLAKGDAPVSDKIRALDAALALAFRMRADVAATLL